MDSPSVLAEVEESRDISAFIEAAKSGDLEAVTGFVEGVGLDVDACVAQYRRTGLHWACEGGNLEMCQALIDYAADVNFADKNGATPLHWAAWNGHAEVVKLLLASGADKHLEDGDRETPLQGASNKDVQALLETPRSRDRAQGSSSGGEENWKDARGRIQTTVKTLVDETVRLHAMVEKLVGQNGRLLRNQKELVAEVMRLKGIVNDSSGDAEPDVLKRLGISAPQE